MLVLAIKALVVFFLRMPVEYLQRQVQSHLVIAGFCLLYHCNSLYLYKREEKHISTLVAYRNEMQNVLQYTETLFKSTLVSDNEYAPSHTHTHTHTDMHTHAHMQRWMYLRSKSKQYRENLTTALMKNWAILTALIHQQTMMQSEVKCDLVFFALTELFVKTFSEFLHIF